METFYLRVHNVVKSCNEHTISDQKRRYLYVFYIDSE